MHTREREINWFGATRSHNSSWASVASTETRIFIFNWKTFTFSHVKPAAIGSSKRKTSNQPRFPRLGAILCNDLDCRIDFVDRKKSIPPQPTETRKFLFSQILRLTRLVQVQMFPENLNERRRRGDGEKLVKINLKSCWFMFLVCACWCLDEDNRIRVNSASFGGFFLQCQKAKSHRRLTPLNKSVPSSSVMCD